MSINLNVTDEDKKLMANLLTECQVLDHLLRERKVFFEATGKKILETNSLSVNLYALRFDSRKDTWEAILKPTAISIPTPGTNVNNIKKN